MKTYKAIEPLGSGAYATVIKARQELTNILVAIKKFKHDNCQNGNSLSFFREVATQKRIQAHPSIIKLLDVHQSTQQNKFQLVYQYIQNDLRKFIQNLQNALSPHEVRDIMYQIVQGVKKIHQCFVLHRDLKPQNILINDNKQIKIADFGLAKQCVSKYRDLTHEVQTLYYRAPQILLGQKRYTFAMDCWAVGCIFAELISKTPLFQGSCEYEMIVKIFQLCGNPKTLFWSNGNIIPEMNQNFPKFQKKCFHSQFPTLSSEGIDLLERLLTVDFPTRISMKEAVNHPYFSNVSARIKALYE